MRKYYSVVFNLYDLKKKKKHSAMFISQSFE